jgi:hypothetical protein
MLIPASKVVFVHLRYGKNPFIEVFLEITAGKSGSLSIGNLCKFIFTANVCNLRQFPRRKASSLTLGGATIEDGFL